MRDTMPQIQLEIFKKMFHSNTLLRARALPLPCQEHGKIGGFFKNQGLGFQLSLQFLFRIMSTTSIGASCMLSLEFFLCLFISYLNQYAQIAEPHDRRYLPQTSAKCSFFLFLLLHSEMQMMEKWTSSSWQRAVLHCHLLRSEGCSSMVADGCKLEDKIKGGHL